MKEIAGLALILLLGFVAAVTSCKGAAPLEAKDALEAQALAASEKFCKARLVATAELSASLKETCDERADRVNAIAHDEPDCLVYMGWATLEAKDVCK